MKVKRARENIQVDKNKQNLFRGKSPRGLRVILLLLILFVLWVVFEGFMLVSGGLILGFMFIVAPFIIAFLFIESFDNAWLRKIIWLFFSVVLFVMGILRAEGFISFFLTLFFSALAFFMVVLDEYSKDLWENLIRRKK